MLLHNITQVKNTRTILKLILHTKKCTFIDINTK